MLISKLRIKLCEFINVQVGAADILQVIMSQRQVMSYHLDGHVLYDVTNMTPITNNSSAAAGGRRSVCCRSDATEEPRLSYIELLLSLENRQAVSKVLDVHVRLSLTPSLATPERY